MTKEYQEALAEVNEILKFSNIEFVKKIPYKLKKFIEDNMDKDYEVILNLNKKLKEQNLKEQTKEIISLIYRDYICTTEEKEKILRKQKEAIELLEQKKSEIYSYDKLFKRKDF